MPLSRPIKRTAFLFILVAQFIFGPIYASDKLPIGTQYSVVSDILGIIFTKQKPLEMTAFIRQTVPKDPKRFESLLNENLPRNPKEAEELMKARIAKLGFLTNGIRWSLIQEVSGDCSVINGIENLDDRPITQTTPSPLEVEKIRADLATEDGFPFEHRWMFDPSEQFGYKVADFFRGSNGAVTSSGTAAPFLQTPELNRFYNLEPEITFLILSTLKTTGPQFAGPINTNCHPSLTDYSQFRISPDHIKAAVDSGAIAVSVTNGSTRMLVKMPNSLTIDIAYTQEGPIYFPSVEMRTQGRLVRTITRDVTPDKPWLGVWRSETLPGFGAEYSQTIRYIVSSMPINIQEQLKKFNRRFVGGAENLTKVGRRGAESLVKTATGYRAVTSSVKPQWLTTNRTAVMTLVGMSVILLAPLIFYFRRRK